MFFHKKELILIFLIYSSTVFANIKSGKNVLISVGTDTLKILKENGFISSVPKSNSDISVVKVKEEDLEKISTLMHDKFHRCGGYMFHEDDLEDAQKSLQKVVNKKEIFVDYSLNQDSMVANFLEQVEERNLITVIEKLSSYHNRYYKSETGLQSQLWLKSHWEKLTNKRNDVVIEKFTHGWKQPSIILTIRGKKYPNQIIVMGGHGDSIAGRGYSQRDGNHAPGADDNASGIAVVTELIRLVVDNNYQPQRTLKFISYSAEEVGLRGSKEISQDLKNKAKNVIGVIQFDMTNYKGSNNDITLVSDYTSSIQNNFLAKLIDKYVGVSWAYGRCGYACSDHASWTRAGFNASFPFEAKMRDSNPHIHSGNDTIGKSEYGAKHAVNFAKLGISYILEMDQ